MSGEHSEIIDLIDKITEAKSDVATTKFWSDNVLREKLISNAERLVSLVRTPEEIVLHQSTLPVQNFTIRTAIDLALFNLVPSSGSGIHIDDLSKAVKVDEHLLTRLLRVCTSISLFCSPSPSHYAQTPLSAIFLSSPHRDHFAQIYDFTGRAVYMLPSWLRTTHYRYPIEYSAAPFQYALGTPLGFWEYLDEDPARAKLFNSGY
ncbi:hypothetical protein ACLMJK_000002 [Lecanora helva]